MRIRPIKYIKWLFYYLLAILARGLVLLLPRRIALGLGECLGHLLFLLLRKERARAIENLSTAFAEDKSAEEILSICRRCFGNLGKSLIEALQFPKLTPQNLGRIVSFEGEQFLADALEAGRGVIIVTAHFGNWELLGVSLALAGYRVNFIIRPARSHRLDQLINRNRESKGVNCIKRGAGVKSALQCLRRNELLGILADVDTKVDGVFVDFFGRSAYTPRGPASIALRTGSAVIPAFIVRQNDDTHKLMIEKPVELKITGNREEDVRINTATITGVIESYIRKYPDHWIWFHKRWKTKPGSVRSS